VDRSTITTRKPLAVAAIAAAKPAPPEPMIAKS